MGIDTSLRKWLKSRVSNGAFSEDMAAIRGDIQIVDLLTRLYRARNANYTHMFTGAELAAHVARWAQDALQNGSAQLVIFCVDEQSRVPTEKKVEQARRDAERSSRKGGAVKYPSGTVICDQGVREPQGVPEPLDVTRLMATRELRPAVWRYLVDIWRRVPPVTTGMFIFDSQAMQAHVFYDGHCFLLQTPHNTFGEGDLKCIYWVRRCSRLLDETSGQPLSILVDSIDSDLLCLLLLYLDQQGAAHPGSLHLLYWLPRWVDLQLLMRHFQSDESFRASDFVRACIWGGTDYVDRKLLFPGLGGTRLMQMLQRAPDLLRLSDASVTDFGRVVRWVTTCWWRVDRSGRPLASGQKPDPQKLPKLAKLESVRDHGLRSGTSFLAKRPVLMKVRTDWCFNWSYWNVDWTAPHWPTSLPYFRARDDDDVPPTTAHHEASTTKPVAPKERKRKYQDEEPGVIHLSAVSAIHGSQRHGRTNLTAIIKKALRRRHRRIQQTQAKRVKVSPDV